MKTVTFNVPYDYDVPDNVRMLEPRVLCTLFDAISRFIEQTEYGLLEQQKEYHQQQQEQQRKEYHQQQQEQQRRVEEQQRQYQQQQQEQQRRVEEQQRQHQQQQQEQQRQHQLQVSQLRDEMKRTKDRLETEYDEKIIQQKKRLYTDFETELHESKKRFVAEQEYTMNSLKQQLETTHKNHEQQVQMFSKEKAQYEDKLTKRMDELLSVFNSIKTNSVSKGQFGEQFLRTFLQQQFPKAEVIDVSHVPHSGDVVLKCNDTSIMIEMKTKTCVSREDLVKFEKDIVLHQHEYDACVFLTTSAGIPNKGEFTFEFNGPVPVIYVSKFIEAPLLLNLATNVLLDLTPIFKEYRRNNRDNVELDHVFETLSCVVTLTTTMCEFTRQNVKSFNTLAQTALDQKKKSEEKVQWCMNEIHRLTDVYKTKLRTTTTKHTNTAAIELLFDVLYNETKPNEKYVYKTIVQAALDKKVTGQYTTKEQIFKILPKSRFDEMCKKVKVGDSDVLKV